MNSKVVAHNSRAEDLELEKAVTEYKAGVSPAQIENNILRFIRILRSLGVRVSLVEGIEALAVLKKVDILNKEEVKIALRSMLVKDYEKIRIYNRVFEYFFASFTLENEEAEAENLDSTAEEETEEEEVLHDPISRADLDEEEEEERELEVDLDPEQQEFYDQLDPEIKEQVNEQVRSKFSETLLRTPQNESMVKNFIQGSLRYWQAKLNENRDNLIDLDTTVDVKKTGERELDNTLRQLVSKLDEEDEFILAKDIREIAETEMDRVTEIIRRLTKQLATKLSRRYKKSSKSKQLDIRATLHNSIKYGGTLAELSYRQQKLKKPKFLLICDVSDSMARYSQFVLQFVYGLADTVKGIDSFIFADDLEEVTDYFAGEGSFAEKMASVIGESEQWGGATDLDCALSTFNSNYKSLLTKRTVVFIVSDTKTLRVEKAAAKIEGMQRRVREIIWLNTLPKAMWKHRDSVKAFQKHCRMFKCNMIKDLQRIIKKEFL
ncbi:vWA domain-containing protein [Fuchsiella alkaliacetigena]|uniref:vWA domain-containing protein n=1 Tax=Fuchsiella alkaliacetigena TaxID=957042 RepID=UPI00200AC1D3|nr:VWA domain-containing protein [Fuchsiella alkaliacetigena]MCK8823775.1 VWA domain-containing protein [Fuchsiella alkaliacetigena]